MLFDLVMGELGCRWIKATDLNIGIIFIMDYPVGLRLTESLNMEEEAKESVPEQYNVRLNWPLLA